MPVAFGTSVSVIVPFGSSATLGPSGSITTPATNPVVMVAISINSGGGVVNSLTTTGFGGTATEVANIRDANNVLVSIWKIVGPTPNTAGTVQANLSVTSGGDMVVCTFSDAHQTDPSPTGDAVTSSDATSPHTLTPSNLTANDATIGAEGGNAVQTLTAVSPNSRFLDNVGTGAVALGVGDATGTTGTTFQIAGGSVFAKVAARIVSAAAPPPDPVLMGGIQL